MATTSLDVLGGATSSGATGTDVLQSLAGDAGCKAPVAAATTINRASLSGLLVVDGYQTVAGDRVLVWQQTDATQNGIYNVSAGAWTRAIDCDGKNDLYKGTIVAVGNGTTYANVIFVVTTANPVTIGASLAFVPYMFSPGAYLNANGSVPISGNLRLATAGGLARWQWSRVDTEAGGNAGSNLELDAYDDTGTLIGAAMKIGRASRVTDFANLPTIGGASLVSVLPTVGASGASHARGLLPDPGATAGTARFAREDATWAVPVARGGASGLKITNNASVPATSIDVSARSMVIGNAASGLLYVANPAFTINLLLNQVAGGIAEATTKQVSTWYYCYAIAKPDGTYFGLATSIAPPTAPTLPSGYTMSEYLGAVFVDSSGNLMRTIQRGTRAGYFLQSSGNTTAPPVTTSTGTVSLSPYAPATAKVVYGTVWVSTSAGGQYAYAAPNSNYLSTTAPIQAYYSGSSGAAITGNGSILLETTSIFIATTGIGVHFYFDGWEDSANAT